MVSKQRRLAGVRCLRALALLAPCATASCAGLDRNDQGRLQPQTVSGPCQVKKFYILGTTTVRTSLTVANSGGACSFTIFNPDLQIVLNAALVSTPASHGVATVGLTNLGRQAQISYAPQPGYTGPDQFVVTLEPNDLSMAFAVTAQPTPP